MIPPNKRTYQQDPANYREALREAELDEAEGADIMMVKPGMPYLDVIRALRDNSTLPIAAYHVSGARDYACHVLRGMAFMHRLRYTARLSNHVRPLPSMLASCQSL